jgi:hypothetical protein
MSDSDLVRYMVDGKEDAHTTLIDGNGLQSDGGWHQRCSEAPHSMTHNFFCQCISQYFSAA